MVLQLSDVNLNTGFKELIERLWTAHEHPLRPFYRLFCPIYKSGRAALVDESKMRVLEYASHDPHENWLEVVDTDTGNIADRTFYKIYDEKAFTHVERGVVYWYPDDSTRDYALQVINSMGVILMKLAPKA